MRICYLVHTFNLEGIHGGTDMYLNRLIELRPKKTEIFVYTGRQSLNFLMGREREKKLYSFHLHTINTNYSFFKNPATSHFGESFLDRLFSQKFKNYLKRIKPDIVHIFHLLGLSDSILNVLNELKIPFIFSIWDFYPVCPRCFLIKPDLSYCEGLNDFRNCLNCYKKNQKFLNWFYERYNFWESSLKRAKLILAPSFFAKEKFSSYFPSLKEKIEILRPGVEEIPSLKRENKNYINVGYLGCLSKEKGVYFLIDVIKNLPKDKIKLKLFGYHPSIKDKIFLKTKLFSSNIKHFGPYKHSELSKILSDLDLTVVPSFCQETFCFSTYESLMAGVPVIVSDRGALPEAVSYKNEFIFKAGSFEGLENILKRFIENPKILNSIEILKHPITPQSYAESLFKRYLGLV